MNRTRILVVDDEVYIAHILEFSLGMEGYEVMTASSGDEALKSVAACRPDLIVLDVMMPGMDGYEVCSRLNQDEQLAQIPVVLLSARHGEHEKAHGLQQGASAYLTKPFRPAELIEVIRGLLETSPNQTETPSGAQVS